MAGRAEEEKKLESIATVAVGQILARVTNISNEGETVPLLTLKSITSGIIVKEDLGEAVISKIVDKEKYTREGDVVIKLSAPYDAAYVTKEMEGLIIPSFCAVIRGRDDACADTKFLSAFLNSSYVKELLMSKVVGSTRPMIKISDIRALKIPEIPAQDMRDIGEAYMLSGKKRAVLSGMIRAEEKLMENIVLASIKGVAGDE